MPLIILSLVAAGMNVALASIFEAGGGGMALGGKVACYALVNLFPFLGTIARARHAGVSDGAAVAKGTFALLATAGMTVLFFAVLVTIAWSGTDAFD